MVSAWYYQDDSSDPRELHQYSPNREVTIGDLQRIGVIYFNFDVDTDGYMDKVNAFAKERDYKNRDIICVSKDKLPNYDEKLKMFFTEHLHDDEEIRFIIDGTGFFDVRNENDNWIRIHVAKSDLIILPIGIYHRFIPDTNDYIQAIRLFKDEPKWTPVNRGKEADEGQSRVNYLKSVITN
ncbi:1,2-dihydroxy-3-keto-5-methylthiopentene dioxygenase [Clydaea vesicula]|uniref:Acireductone dioxygenase n=1 Tax=Clydaea vesicula TaxID=447962 RepID=A0AAD5UBN5_9FUNG|nr:1,2-dihydroxy-3-keto-5-methylthiopentene dioxygenase [Clydaea vesicula]KAJ3393953.1 1,2-dihydroxy-3-keto-5-methylthiopentene dioxygenase [Lobulomyces angularis]